MLYTFLLWLFINVKEHHNCIHYIVYIHQEYCQKYQLYLIYKYIFIVITPYKSNASVYGNVDNRIIMIVQLNQDNKTAEKLL